MAKAAHAIPAGHRTVTPHLTLDDTAAAIEWYTNALGAEEAQLLGEAEHLGD